MGNGKDGLWLFLFVTALRVFGLIVDYGLLNTGNVTITEFCRRHDWASLAVLVVEISGLVGLAEHFLNGR